MEKTISGTPQELAFNLFQLDKDKIYDITEHKKLRGVKANAYFHKLLNELARYNRSKGFAISDEEMKININLSYGTIATLDDGKPYEVILPKDVDFKSKYEYSKRLKTNGVYTWWVCYKRTSELNTKEFTQLIRGLEVECKEVGIKTLDDIEFERMMEEYDREFSTKRNLSATQRNKKAKRRN